MITAADVLLTTARLLLVIGGAVGLSAGLAWLRRRAPLLDAPLGLICALPVPHIALLIVLLGQVRLDIVPAGLTAWIAALLGAPLAAWFSLMGRPAEAWPGWRGLIAGVLGLPGWLITVVSFAEYFSAAPGIGGAWWAALIRGGGQALPLTLVMLIPAVLMRLGAARLASGTQPPQMRPHLTAPLGSLLAAVLAGLVIGAGLFGLAQAEPAPADPLAVFAKPSEQHPSGTDHLGRDALPQAARAAGISLAGAALAGLITAGLGGLWAAQQPGALPIWAAEALSIIPVPAVWLIFDRETPPLAAAGLIGLALVPRAALIALPSVRRAAALAWLGAAAALIALQYDLLFALSGLGSPEPWASLGGLLRAYPEIIAGAGFAGDGRFYRYVLLSLGWAWAATALMQAGLAALAAQFIRLRPGGPASLLR